MLCVNSQEPSPSKPPASTNNNTQHQQPIPITNRPIKFAPSLSPMKLCELSSSPIASTSTAMSPFASSYISPITNGKQPPQFTEQVLESYFSPLSVPPLYSMSDLEIVDSLGEGFFSKVFKVRHRITRETMVLKVTKPSAMGGASISFSELVKEASTMSKIQHENVIKFWGVCLELHDNHNWSLHLLLAYCDRGSLHRLIKDVAKPLSWRQRIAYAEDVANAMQYVHGIGIMHRDLTSMNILLQSVPSHQMNSLTASASNDNLSRSSSAGSTLRIRAVVADFGLACEIPRQGEKLMQVGTTYWMSPECLMEDYYDERSDVFSFGIILCQLIARIDADPDSGLYRTSNFGLDYLRFTPICPPDTPLDLLRLALQCCLLEPATRPSFSEIRSALRDIRLATP